MSPTWGRRVKGPLGILGVLLLAPMISTSAGPVGSAPAASRDAAAPEPGRIVYSLASRAGARSAIIDQIDSETLLQEIEDVGSDDRSTKGMRAWTVSELANHDLPLAAKRAYQRAAAAMRRTDPGCELPWTLLAGIGRVESDHGRYGGSQLSTDGVSRPQIIGVRLDGTGPVAAIRDTDGGRIDRDKAWDRAVGPMQFIPSTWANAARDGDGDGRMSPHDIDDAAAAAASYLCAGSGSLRDPATQAAAIFSYNQDDYYVALVQAFEVGYRTGVFELPPPPPTEEELEQRRERRAAKLAARRAAAREERREERQAAVLAARREVREERRAAKDRSSTPAPGESPSKSPSKSAEPSPTPRPSPEASPTPTEQPKDGPREAQGRFTECDGGYCLAGKLLDLGAVAQLDKKANGDYDRDGAVESNGDEVAGMLGRNVTMVVEEMPDGRLGIHSINGHSVA
ncbi:MAG: lytic transglycosylase domain-containing protein [Actinomycetota bacterium]